MAKKKTHEEYREELYSYRDDIQLLGEYVNAITKIGCLCKICGHTWDVIPRALLTNKGCPKCSQKRAQEKQCLNFSIIEEEFKSRGVVLLTNEDEFVAASKTKLQYICEVHGEQTILWGNFRKGAGCRKCAREALAEKQKTSFEKIQKAFDSVGYKLLTQEHEYINALSKLKYLCHSHGEQTITWDSFNNANSRCPECALLNRESNLAKELKEYCKEKYPDTITEYKILKNPKTGRWLPYDIYIPSLNVFVEVQGTQHHKYNPWFHKSIEDFEKQCERDDLKEIYAWRNGRYIDISVKDNKDLEDAIRLIEYGRSEVSNLAGLFFWTDEIKAKTPIPKYNL